MVSNFNSTKDLANSLLNNKSKEEVLKQLQPNIKSKYQRFKSKAEDDHASLKARWDQIPEIKGKSDLYQDEDLEVYHKNIENMIGTVKVPVGVAGPLRINGTNAKGDYLVPLATTEAALVASYHRGSTLISKVGGCTTVLMAEGVTRSPGFIFNNSIELAEFMHWILKIQEKLIEISGTTTSHGSLNGIRFSAEGNHLYLLCDFLTGDAAGQNMVTIATQAICEYIIAHTPVQPKYWFVEANASGDKKASALSFSTVRGKKVSAEVTIPKRYIEKFLHTNPQSLAEYWKMSAIGGVMSGTIGIQGHYANGLAAIFLACGQDVACVSEASVGVTRFEITDDGSLYTSVTLPNLIIGTVGGGTSLPSQKANLEILNLHGDGKSRAFAEVCAAIALAGEISIIGSLAAGDFTKAHETLARKK